MLKEVFKEMMQQHWAGIGFMWCLDECELERALVLMSKTGIPFSVIHSSMFQDTWYITDRVIKRDDAQGELEMLRKEREGTK